MVETAKIMETSILVDRLGNIKDQIKALSAQADQITYELAARAEFKGDSKTSAPIFGSHFTAKIQLKEITSFDNKALREQVWPVLGDKILDLFDWEFKAKTKNLTGYLQYGEHRDLVLGTRTVKDAKPYISIEPLESC
jgi:hypothetical protein